MLSVDRNNTLAMLSLLHCRIIHFEAATEPSKKKASVYCFNKHISFSNDAREAEIFRQTLPRLFKGAMSP